MGSRAERIKRKREERRRKQQAEAQSASDNAKASADDVSQATVKRRLSLFCSPLDRELKLSALSLAEQGEIKEAALSYYRKTQLTSRLQELKVLREQDLLSGEDFDDEVLTARNEVRQLTFDDLPKMKVPGQKGLHDYVNFYMAATSDGQITTVLVSVQSKQPDVTRRDLHLVMQEDPEFFIEASEIISDLTQSLIAKKSRRRR